MGASHSACSDDRADMLNACTAGLVLSAIQSNANGALRAICIRQRQVMIAQILWRTGFFIRSIEASKAGAILANLPVEL